MDINTLKPRILEILRQSNLAKISTKSVREQLQLESSVPLGEYKKPLKALIEQCYETVLSERENDESEEEEESDSEEEAPIVAKKAKSSLVVGKSNTKKKPAATAKTATKAKATKKEKAPKRQRKPQDPASKEKNPFTRTWILSPELAAVTGEQALSRPSVVKHLWNYIKTNNLQDPEKKTHIFCDDKLKAIFNNESYMSGFTMNKFIGKHLVGPAAPPESEGGGAIENKAIEGGPVA
ncbi:SWIB/MDM2 domain-containing protein [Zychaea mexicana]|uniref:SWIB/MDM2 domain-containing protein n=1 Tax=Zychaea mexicana TaxID=64656 RepID=UPI0022FE0C59|nr:SWIB/MDM2 domain-containing protein [Zychaea mexicana]KAI9499078.1 SWIB/MDM2 domain-containing protein [Zychaea mexicana]